MNYYSSYTGNKKRKTIRRVIIVILSVAVIFGGTVVFGNYLKKKAGESTVKDFGGVGRDESDSNVDTPAIIPPSQGGQGSSVSVAGCCIPLEYTKPDAEVSFDEKLKEAAKDYSGILIPLTGDDGLLLYDSARAAAASRLPSNPSLPGMDVLKDAVAKAKALGLRCTAVINSGVDIHSSESKYDAAIATDSRVAADAAEAGFDEIIVCSLVNTPEEITGDSSTVILRYLNQMCASAGETKVGLSFPYEIYDTAALSPRIELFISRSVFLAMEFSTEKSTVDHLTYVCENLAGSLSLYNMRMLLSPSDGEVASALAEKLRAVEHENYYFVVPTEPVKDETGEPAVTETDD